MTTIFDPPEPGSDAAQRSKMLAECIRKEINAQGRPISFAKFMEMALYHPEFGYYNARDIEIGKKGDFTTAPEISPLFSRCFTQQLVQIAELFGTVDILEIGAGSGRLSKDLLTELNNASFLPGHYYIYEISPSLRQKQHNLISNECADFLQNITWLEQLPENFDGIIIMNEVLDAAPVHCFKIEEDGIKERCVTWKNDQFEWEITEPTTPELKSAVENLTKLYHLESGYQSEINLNLHPFISAIANSLIRGVILIADYGYGQKEYYHPQRDRGTLTCFYQHNKHDNPLVLPGLQDITAHVDFTRVIDIASDYHCSLKGFTTQASFLLACGLLNIVDEEQMNLTALQQIKLFQAMKVLTMPTEMGDVVKVMALGRKVGIPLIGFTLKDRSRDL